MLIIYYYQANRKLYCPGVGRYVTRDRLLEWVKEGKEVSIHQLSRDGTRENITNSFMRKMLAYHYSKTNLDAPGCINIIKNS